MKKVKDMGSCPQAVSAHLRCPQLGDRAGQSATQEVGLSFQIPCLSPFVILFEICWGCCHPYSLLSHCARIEEVYFPGAIFSHDTAIKPIEPGSLQCAGSRHRLL